MTEKEFSPEQIYAEIVKSGDDWSDKDAAATLLEETKSSVLAELMNNQDQKLSMAAKESLARADPAYRLHIARMVEARKLSNRAKVRFDGAKLLADLRRSEHSTQRAQMRGA